MTVKKEGNKITATIGGKLDRTSSPVFEKDINEKIDENTNQIILDLSDTIYVSSAGLRVILGLEKKMENAGGSLELINIPELVMEVFTETGLDELLTLR